METCIIPSSSHMTSTRWRSLIAGLMASRSPSRRTGEAACSVAPRAYLHDPDGSPDSATAQPDPFEYPGLFANR
jgi:hypothetical protein